MTREELQALALKAMQAAQAERYTPTEAAGREQVARAWERLADAADSLHAIKLRQALYDEAPDPPPFVR